MDVTRSEAVVVEVDVDAAELDEATGELWARGALAIEERERPDGGVRLVTSCADPAACRALASQLGHRWTVAVTDVDDSVYDTWRDHARPARAGHRIVLCPPWYPVGFDAPDVLGNDIVVTIDPGRAFGSGAHPTTRLVLGELERLVAPDTRVLDVGCGGGALAVTAALLGARTVAIDIDPAATDATRANAERNGVTDRVLVSGDPLGSVGGDHDVVVANIGGLELITLAPALAERVRPGGALVTSGILADRWRDHVAAFTERAPGLRLEGVGASESWACLTYRRVDDAPPGRPVGGTRPT
ncbi:MAG: 50S ribosomal protein L11 methyltransferase [Actinomycetota bacterium]|nr:50S ribosomal protein L11 methyltransferase [Actinomycetota bacterium]